MQSLGFVIRWLDILTHRVDHEMLYCQYASMVYISVVGNIQSCSICLVHHGFDYKNMMLNSEVNEEA